MTEIIARTNTTPKTLHDGIAEKRYTKCSDETGWLMIKLDDSAGSRVSVPEFVEVVLTQKLGKDGKPTKDNETRVFFLVTEGRYKGKTASLTKENAAKCLIKTKRGEGAQLTAKIIERKKERSVPQGNAELNQLWATLSFDGKKARITLDSDEKYKETDPTSPYYGQIRHSKPLPKGTYKIITPIAAHNPDDTSFYRTDPGGYPGLKYDTVWFQIENAATNNSNFVHVGHISHGCVTVYQLEMWEAVYKYLISNRMDKDAKYIGTVTIE